MKNMKKYALVFVSVFAAVYAQAAQQIMGSTDKNSYRCGEEIVFTFDVKGDNPDVVRKVQWELRGDSEISESGKADVAQGASFEVKTTGTRPGFVHVNAHILGEDGRRADRRDMRWQASAGVEPENIRGADEPDDFDAFWARQKQRLAGTPWKEGVKREKVDVVNAKFDIYRLSVPAPGPRPATAHMLVPKNAGPDAKVGVSLTFEGYGWGGRIWPNPDWYGTGEIVIGVNAHGFELGRDEEYNKEFERSVTAKGMYGFVREENEDPETTYFNGMILRGLRMIEYAKTLPEWDGKNLKVGGGSQGGFQALVMAGLDGDVTSADANVPWLCDMGGRAKLGRWGGWQPDYTAALEYYDPVHHAARIPETCKVYISRNGMGDVTCTPSGVYAVYNNVRGPKRMRMVQGSEHGDWGGMPAGTQEFVVED